MTAVIDNINIQVHNEEIPEEEIRNYIARGREKYGRSLSGIDIHVDGEYVDLKYHVDALPFQRIRRITGYLVGTMDRFNNAKRAEEAARVKHSV